jgi:hypothetical protein
MAWANPYCYEIVSLAARGQQIPLRTEGTVILKICIELASQTGRVNF